MSEESGAEGFRPQKRLFTFLFVRKVSPVPLPEERKRYPFYHANFISQFFFLWLFPIMRTGYSRTLQKEDLFYLDEELKVAPMYERFSANLAKRSAEAQRAHDQLVSDKKAKGTYNSEEDEGLELPKFTLIWTLWDTFGMEYLFSAFLASVNGVALTLNPLLTKALINFVENKALGEISGVGKGVGYAIGSTLLVIFAGIATNHSIHSSSMVGAKVKAVLTKAILEKSFLLNATSRYKYDSGTITSMMAADLSRLDLAIGFQPIACGFFVAVIIAVVLLIVNVGVSGLVGTLILVITVSILFYYSTTLFKYRKKAIVHTDERVGYLKDLLSNMKVIKFYSWEKSYFKQILEARTKEMKYLLQMQVLRSLFFTVGSCLPQLSSMVTFLMMFSISNGRNAADIFSSLTLLSVLSQQATFIPIILASGSDALMAVFRVSNLLAAGEIDQEEHKEIYRDVESLEADNVAIRVNEANFKWKRLSDLQSSSSSSESESGEVTNDKSETTSIASEKSQQLEVKETQVSELDQGFKFSGLHNINLEIKKGEFIVVTGVIASGKSSLLHALFGDMHKLSGSLKVNGTQTLCGQPWVQNSTVRENILFGQAYDSEFYDQVVHACSLEADMDILPAGDRTEIGERGITLSGGQKARLCLARAVYVDRDIILLDDVLSAVDAKVGKDIMENCINGILKEKTRILATHQLSLIGSADRIVFLNGDGTIDVGTLNELLARNKGFSELMDYRKTVADEEEEKEVEEEEEQALERQKTAGEISKLEKQATQNKQENDGRLIKAEGRAVNGVKFDVYRKYVQLGSGALGPFFLPVFIIIVALSTFGQIFTNTWLSFWVEEKFDRARSFYTGIYIMLTFVSIIVVYIQFWMLVQCTNAGAKWLNLKAVEKILSVPMSFLDTTPIGRILNRFTKDTDALDNEIVEQLRNTVFQTANVIGVLILCIIYLPWFAIAIPFLILFYFILTNFYQASSLEIKRLESIQRSLVYNNFNETITGMATIQVYNSERRFLQKNDISTDDMNEAYFLTNANQRWLGVFLSIISSFFAFIITMLSVTGQFHISAASTGLLVSYVLQIPGQMSLIVRCMTRVEIDMNSAERLYEYAYQLESEAAFEISDTKPRPTWPEEGAISFQDVSLAYRPGLPLVLKDLSFDVKATEKIGICGRTGAGKSSIMIALYRLAELSSGKLIIDGIDVSKLGLRDLRSKMSIIPQDPILFKGTIRSNLDPFEDYDDETLWDSLKKSGLIAENQIARVKLQKTADSELHKFHLDQQVEADGANFSLGEKQLIALARAVVRNSKILVLDEATSSVDYETDAKIQAAIVREFDHCTILCIAHRLNTIIDYDRILVLDQGELAEFDTPWTLFQDPNSIFHDMCVKSNITSDDFTRKS